MELEELSRDLDAATAQFERVSRRLALAGDAGRACGADGPGQLGVLGRALSGLSAQATAARTTEFDSVGVTLGVLSDGVRHAAAAYRDIESGSAPRP